VEQGGKVAEVSSLDSRRIWRLFLNFPHRYTYRQILILPEFPT
jgi:hypothetical protein